MKPDLDCPENIRQHVDNFYEKVLKDEVLAHIFLDVANIDIDEHLAIIAKYWEKLLLANPEYQRHTMNIHRDIHQQFAFTDKEFERWLMLFVTTLDAHFEGPSTDRARKLAQSIAHNMNILLNEKDPARQVRP